MLTIGEMQKKAVQIRLRTLKTVYQAKSGHIGGDLSSTDIMVALHYGFLNTTPENQNDPQRDRFILSKGHSVETYYSILADKGYFSEDMLDTYLQYNTKLFGHPSKSVPGIEFNTGALGHGLSVGVGMALGAKKCGFNSKICVLMGDGELAEGSIWEAAMAASQYKLNNLIAIIDRNGLQISGTTEYVMHQENIKNRWMAFGFNVIEVDGNNISEVLNALKLADSVIDAPTCIVAKTVKGKGVSFMENNRIWHHKIPSPEQYSQAIEELKMSLEVLK